MFKISPIQSVEEQIKCAKECNTEYKEGAFGYDFSKHFAWLYEENTGAISEAEYDEFIENLKSAQKDGHYIFSKPYYIYKGVKL